MQCPKCAGKGYIQEYGHIARGVCFQCNGKGYVASNGKRIKSVKMSQITIRFPGFSKREMKELIDNSYHITGIEYIKCKQADPMYDKFVRCGIYSSKTLNNGAVKYTPINHYADYRPLYDLTK